MAGPSGASIENTDDADDEDSEVTTEYDGRAICVSTNFYNVQVYGEPGDSLDDLVEILFTVTDQAMKDNIELDTRLDESQDNRKYR